MRLNPSSVNNILLFSLTNIGDIVLTFPVIDVLLNDCPQAKLTVIVGPNGDTFFKNHPRVEAIVYDKRMTQYEVIKWFFKLNRNKYDLLVDLRNTGLPFFINARVKTWPVLFSNKRLHLKDKHLKRLASVWPVNKEQYPRRALYVEDALKQSMDALLKDFLNEPFIVVVPQAADLAKTWPEECFIDFVGVKKWPNMVFLGSAKQERLIDRIIVAAKGKCLNLAGRTNLIEAAYVISKAHLSIVHDSGLMHVSSYMNTPMIALFGPTDPALSGPWSERSSMVLREHDQCERCQRPGARHISHQCMKGITVKQLADALTGFWPTIDKG